jgi:hypothetical protein
MELEHAMSSEINQVQKDKSYIFSQMWKTDPTIGIIIYEYI